MVTNLSGEKNNPINSHPKDKLIVAMAFDDKYLFPALVAIYSAYLRQASRFKLLVAYDSAMLSPVSRNRIYQVCELIGLELGFIELRLPKFLATHGHFSALTWARLFLPEEIDRPFVYLDADTVCDNGWGELFANFDLGTTGISAVLQGINGLSADNAAVAASKGNYISAGVMVVRPALLPITFREEALEACKNYSQNGFQWVDQDVINFVLEGRVDLLESRFNVLVPLVGKKKLEGNILHFAGSQKPWTALYRFRYFYSFSVKRWGGEARRMLKGLETLGFDVSPLRESFRLLAVDDGLDILSYRGFKRWLLPVVRKVFSKL
jgi:lipopolysaccharide biosynthesis glycosyltransferase